MRILICEDSVLLREGIVRLLEDAGHDVVAAIPDATSLDDAVAAGRPDLCILDVRLPPTFTDEGIRAALRLRAANPHLPVLVLSQYVEERYAADLIGGRGGALGYLLKDRVADVTEFLESVEQIAAGGTVLDPEVVAQLLGRRQVDERMQRLTARESTVLGLLAEGKSNQAIARTLHLTEGSVEKHITAVFQKLGLEQDDSGNRRVLAALAHLEHGGGSPQTGA
ncbi:MAG TPA: response regulator transcription factor [Microbacterium sp.]|uniref:response regulator transcription factor n=1 Tax=Microbacterium sp. TaxID=51671 RepID=UPI002CD4A71D|nr:response regulator transcription factor [Microbacterium sp.]HWI31039.1 response regulator transcription factor [Microbacterium sp.]